MTLLALFAATPAQAQRLAPQQRLCDPEVEDCRADILTYIAQETVEIDMGFWLMDDARYSNALVAAYQRGVKIRLLMDPRCTSAHAACASINDQLSQAGLPMRKRIAGGILHWKMALFASQGQVQFSGANYSPFEMVPEAPYQNYTDEIVMFTNDPSLVHSFMTKFDDLWTSTTEFGNYANISGALTRSYPTYPQDPQLNFPPDQSYRDRTINAINAETAGIDVAMFRITDEQQSNAIIAAVNRGVPVRLFTDETEYRNPSRLWDAYNVDKMYHAGVTVRVDAHQGLNHEKLVVLRGQGMTIFGSSNWTSPSTDSQREHNMFTTQSWIYAWAEDQFDRKWTNRSGFPQSQPFTPLPPDVPANTLPANGAGAVPASGTALSWNAGLWGQIYDIYLGTSPNPPLFAENQQLGPSQSSTDDRMYPLPPLRAGTTYYWRIVSKTMAYVTAAGPVWSFTTAAAPAGNRAPSISITSPSNGAAFKEPATITIAASASDSDGAVSRVDFYAGNILLGSDAAAPYTLQWNSVPAGSYALTAVATDNRGTTSPATVFVTVGETSRTLAPRGDDFVVWRPSSGTWYWLTESSTTGEAVFGGLGDTPLTGDLDGDGRKDLVIWRPSTGAWYWLTSTTSYNASRAGGLVFGGLGDVPLLGDVDGDGRADLIVWRPSTGIWYWLTSSSGFSAVGSRQFGGLGDTPMLGDVDGDGRSDLMVWRGSNGTFYWTTSSSGYGNGGAKQWGIQSAGDVPLAGDVDGDGKADLVVWRGPTGKWYCLTSSSGYSTSNAMERVWGSAPSGDVPSLLDRDSDGIADITVWRRSSGTWYVLQSTTGFTSGQAQQWGASTDVPIVK